MFVPIPEGIATIELPNEIELLEAARRAATQGLHLVTDGRRTVLSPTVMPGWHRLGVSVKEAA